METIELVRDFVNTRDLLEDSEELGTPADLASWLEAHGLARAGCRAHPRRTCAARSSCARHCGCSCSRNNGLDVPEDEAYEVLARRRAPRPGRAGVRGARGASSFPRRTGSTAVSAASLPPCTAPWPTARGSGSRPAGRPTASGRSSTRRATTRARGARWPRAATARRRAPSASGTARAGSAHGDVRVGGRAAELVVLPLRDVRPDDVRRC